MSYIYMPLQRRKKKKAPPKKSSGMSQVQNVKVVVNASSAPRRRRARARNAGAPFSFGGGGGGGGGLAQVVTGPSVSQDVLQQSQELKQTLAMLQAGPMRNNAVLGEIGQIERPLIADEQPVTRAQLKFIMGSVIEQQTLLQNEARGRQGEQYRALAGQQLNILESSIHSLSTNKPEQPAVDRSESPEPLHQQASPRGRSPTVRESSMAAVSGTPPASPSPQPAKKSRAPTYPQELRDSVFAAWSENKQKPRGEQLSLEALARASNLTLNTFNNIRQAESRKRG